MSRTQKLISLKRAKNEKIDEISDALKKLNAMVEPAQEMKRDNEADIFFLEKAPDEFIEENADRLIVLEEAEYKKLSRATLEIQDATRSFFLSLNSTTTSGSASVEVSFFPRTNLNLYYPEMNEVANRYKAIAEDKARKKELPEKLDRVNHRLGEMFTEAIKMVEIGRADVMKANKALIDMRSVLDQLWGGLVKIYRAKSMGNPDSEQGKEITKPSHREDIADVLALDDQTKRSWLVLLESIAQLQGEISMTQQLKNPLNEDIEKLDEFYTRWITHINNAVNLLTALGLFD